MIASCRIKKIAIEKLFGHYNYNLFLGKNVDDKILILYGDNGCGKSTVLNLAFHLLAPERGQGHKTAIARIPFKKFSVELSSGETVVAERNGNETTGGYILSIVKRGKITSCLEFVFDSERNLVAKTREEMSKNSIWLQLKKINTCYNLLSDNRSIRLSNYFCENDEFNEYDYVLKRRITRNHDYFTRGNRDDDISFQDFQTFLLMRSISKAEQWLRRNFMRAASQGESSVNSLYGEILRALSLDSSGSDDDKKDKTKIIDNIRSLEAQSQNFSQYGLLPSFHTKEIIQILKQADDSILPLMVRTLNPYLKSIEKKIDALNEPYNRVNTFIKTLNKFFYDKEICMDINSGLKIKSNYGGDILPSMLSSGERHLLLLFCNSLIMDKSSIIMIDEPEISLNIKWQRMLLSSLMSVSENQPVQYIFATHSIELLSEFKDHVVKIEHMVEMKKC